MLHSVLILAGMMASVLLLAGVIGMATRKKEEGSTAVEPEELKKAPERVRRDRTNDSPTRRDLFAAAALQALATNHPLTSSDYGALVGTSVEIADAMIKKLDETA